MRISDFVNALADNPESNIVHESELCDHDWEVNVETIGVDVYSAQRGPDGTMQVVFEGADAESTESQRIFRIVCRDCGAEADEDQWAEVERAIIG